jgi:hypothetical protein
LTTSGRPQPWPTRRSIDGAGLALKASEMAEIKETAAALLAAGGFAVTGDHS